MAMRVTWFIVVAALAVGCEQRSPRPGETGQQAGAPAGEGAQSGSAAATAAQPGTSAPSTLDKIVAAVTPKAEFKEVTSSLP